jgi:hypothetical protein
LAIISTVSATASAPGLYDTFVDAIVTAASRAKANA